MIRSSAAVLASLLLAGCAAGPDFHRPVAPAVHDYTAAPLTTTAATPGFPGGAPQHFRQGGDIPARWWQLFHSQPLDRLIRQALAGNPDLKAAQAALLAARENALAGRGAYYPGVDVGVSANRQQDPPGALAPVPSSNASLYNLLGAQVNVSYMPDVFGLNRRTVESLDAQAQAARYEMIATDMALAANVAVTAIQVASLREQLKATQQLAGIDAHVLSIMRYQLAKGYVGRLDVAAQEAQLAQVNAALPGLRTQLAQQQHRLAVLAGRFPSEGAAATFTLADLALPRELPLSLPSALVAQRPDVLQAEANLHAASAQVGVAIANRLPNLTLSADAGSTALTIGRVFTAGTGFWGLGAALAAPIFEGGSLRHQERAARAAYTQAAEQYRSTVLAAFEDVADTLTALQQDAQALQAAAAADRAAGVTLDLAQRQWKDGYAGYLAVLSAEQAALQARIGLVQAQASRYADTVALFQALGGGWWHRADLAQDDDAPAASSTLPTKGDHEH
ncbi:MAG TPA: efflux transporter outer membrane subunit [Frateuria sp.]|uniref:efflux transporter outer membrane subunit n=1 Tax=Frateuria sp. TaxID=2211372 RepID=UPI002D804D4B|nr:efflux transporter outer membrane subunit [Frateuria sp.]HET6805815.1 efflux transporter outer membrane subunit [Frateuria sp.]